MRVGSALYMIFEVQAWISLVSVLKMDCSKPLSRAHKTLQVVGGLLSFNVLYPTDEPSIARLLG